MRDPKLPTKIEVGHLAHGSQFRRWPRGLIWTVDRHQEDYTFATPVTAVGRPGQQRMLPSYTVVYCFDSFRWQDARTTGTYLFLEDTDE